MILKATPLALIAVLGLVKFLFLFEKSGQFEKVGWLAGTLVWSWLGWAYWKDKDMPTYSGDFSYKNGQNDFARTVYIIVMLFCFLLGVIGT